MSQPVDFNASFNRIMRKQEAKARQKSRAKKARALDLGDTARGLAQFKRQEPVRSDTLGGLNIIEIPAYRSHASRHNNKKES